MLNIPPPRAAPPPGLESLANESRSSNLQVLFVPDHDVEYKDDSSEEDEETVFRKEQQRVSNIKRGVLSQVLGRFSTRSVGRAQEEATRLGRVHSHSFLNPPTSSIMVEQDSSSLPRVHSFVNPPPTQQPQSLPRGGSFIEISRPPGLEEVSTLPRVHSFVNPPKPSLNGSGDQHMASMERFHHTSALHGGNSDTMSVHSGGGGSVSSAGRKPRRRPDHSTVVKGRKTQHHDKVKKPSSLGNPNPFTSANPMFSPAPEGLGSS